MEQPIYDELRLPKISYVSGDKNEIKYAAMIQTIVLLLSWGRVADREGVPLTEEDIVDILKAASNNYGPNKEDLDNGPHA